MTDATLETIDAAIVSGGVVGWPVCAMAARGHATCIIDRLPRPGLEASTRNSGVVHAGIHYPRDSLKTALCVEGRDGCKCRMPSARGRREVGEPGWMGGRAMIAALRHG